MKSFLSILFSVCTLYVAHAQYDPSKVKKKAMELYDKALVQAQDGKFKEGIQMLNEAVKIDPNFLEAYLSIAGMYGEMKQYQNAIDNYNKAKSIDTEFFKDYNLPYSINLAGKGEFEQALAAVNEFLTISDLNASSRQAGEYRQKSYSFALQYRGQKSIGDYKFDPVNLGDNINSKVSEYFPTITIDGRQLVYTRRVNNFNEDFFGAELAGGQWGLSHGLPGDINTNQNEGAQNISQDGQWLIFTGCNFPDGIGSCDLYISYLTPDGWSAPENLGSGVNSDAWESAPSLSPDKRDLYFSSNRAGGYGASDIYVSHRLSNGKWTEPEILGPEINTPGNESCPFIHSDNQTLYFTSNGHLGYGGDDLFVAKKGPKNVWGKAVNLGYPINTIENEGSLVVAADGKTAYYASDRSDSRGGLDIYSFELRNDVRPAKTLWVRGKVFDKKTTKGLPSAVELTDLSTQEILSKVQTNETGSYLITLPVGHDYAFNVNRRGYLFFSENFSLSHHVPDSTYNIDIPLQPLEANAAVILKNIFFEVNKYDLQPASTSELDKVVTLLKENPTLKIQINGHTDNVGKPADNLKLSNDRAQSVVKYLVTKGIDIKRVLFRGFGATQPISSNDTEEGKAQNRRTELTVISQ